MPFYAIQQERKVVARVTEVFACMIRRSLSLNIGHHIHVVVTNSALWYAPIVDPGIYFET